MEDSKEERQKAAADRYVARRVKAYVKKHGYKGVSFPGGTNQPIAELRNKSLKKQRIRNVN